MCVCVCVHAQLERNPNWELKMGHQYISPKMWLQRVLPGENGKVTRKSSDWIVIIFCTAHFFCRDFPTLGLMLRLRFMG